MRAADPILLVTPEDNYSILGVLKNAIAWAFRPYGASAWSGKPVAVMGASIGNIGTARAQYHLGQRFVFLNMLPVNQPEIMIANAAQRFEAAGNLTDEPTRNHIRHLLQSLVDWTRPRSIAVRVSTPAASRGIAPGSRRTGMIASGDVITGALLWHKRRGTTVLESGVPDQAGLHVYCAARPAAAHC